MRETPTIAELAAELDGLAIAYESMIWKRAGHEHPLEFAEWQAAFQDARNDPGNESLADECNRQLHRLLFD